MKKEQRLTSLPEQMVNDIQKLGLTKSQLNAVYKFLDILKSKSFRKYKVYDNSIELPKTYITKVFNSKYIDWLAPLKESGIIKCNEFYTYKDKNQNKSQCKTYNLNPTYFTHTNLSYQLIPYMCPLFRETEENQAFQGYKEMVSEDLKTLEFDFQKLKELALKKINSITIDSFKTGETITNQFFQVIIQKNKLKYWMTKESALRIAQEDNLTLIQDQKTFYIANAEEFVKMKKNVYRDAYIGSINKIEKEYWYADRNSTNNRLDSNITNLCSDLTEEIIKSNNLVQFDLANSQFAILSHLLNKKEEITHKEDFRLFKEFSESGELYDKIKDELGLKTRKEAKIMLFELLFSSERNRSENKRKIERLFPNVVAWIDNYKANNGYEQFAVWLQQEESKMFIDDIYLTLKERGLFCLTKHDSLIVKKENEIEVEEFLIQYFESINFNAKLVK